MGKKGMTPKQAAQVWQGKTKLRNLRVEKGLSQSELAVVSGISKATIVCYEHKKRPIESAKLNTLCDLADTLDCTIEDLIENESLAKKYRKVK